jgi:hypothetical protein
MEPIHIILAQEFTARLRATLTSEKWIELIDLNSNESNPAICHSHDYCDANQIMIDSISFIGIEYSAESTLWSDAWLHARLELFDNFPMLCRNGKAIDKCFCC